MTEDKTNELKNRAVFPVIGIGASAGGLNAFRRILGAIPDNSGMAYVLVQHLDPHHESLLKEILQKVTSIPVLEISDDIKVEPNHIYVIPSNKIMVARDGVLKLLPRTNKKTAQNLPIDIFFNSLANVYQARAIGVVLSGTATDGTNGLRAIKEHGGITFAQDQDSAEYNGMPNSAVLAGVVDFVLPPEEIPRKLLAIAENLGVSDADLQNMAPEQLNVFKQILSFLRTRKGVDFTYYKQTTVRRRILRRIVINKCSNPLDYLFFLRDNIHEPDLLFHDLLIPVTSFFRDKKTFEDVCENIFPAIVKHKTPGETIRLWVAGCSTGQEVYSFAICFQEFLGDNDVVKLQIFGSDLNDTAVTKARSGNYEKNEVEGLSAERLSQFFTKNGGRYQVNKQIRDMCVFAHHNLLKDPPFGKMDFISCRNVLIYMEPYLQKKALTTFHYALNPKGILLLGKSETTGVVPDLFSPIDKNDKLFLRKDGPGGFIQMASQRSEQLLSRKMFSNKKESAGTDFQQAADEVIMRQFTPPSVVVNETFDIVQYRGDTNPFLSHLSGKPTHNLLLLAKPGLAFELRNILHKARIAKEATIKEDIPLPMHDGIRTIAIEAVPLTGTVDPFYLVVFHDRSFAEHETITDAPGTENNSRDTTAKRNSHEERIRLLEQELAQAREDMRSITQDQEAYNEELQSANEELLSSSEELQSLNEELETSKEELQSTNEELTVLNHELITLNGQVGAARNFAESIVATVAQPLLVLDASLHVRTANPAFYSMFGLTEATTENTLIYELGNQHWNDPALRNGLENILPLKKAVYGIEVVRDFGITGQRIILFSAVEIERNSTEERLVLVSLEDVTDRRKAEHIITDAALRFRALLKDLPVAVFSCNRNGRINFYNDAAVQLWGGFPESGDDYYYDLYKPVGADGHPIRTTEGNVAIAFKTKENVLGKETLIETAKGSQFIVRENVQLEYDIHGEITGAIVLLADVTEEVAARKKIEDSEKHFRMLADLMPAKISNAKINGEVSYFNKHWLDFTGMNFEELKDFGYYSIMHPDEIEEFQRRLQQAAQDKKDLIMEMRFKNKAGDYIWHLNIASPVLDEAGNILMWVGVTTDIAEQIKTRNSNLLSYETHARELEQKVQARTIELVEANDQLQQKNLELNKMNKELESFTYISSHDLQEPLRKIRTFAGILQEKEFENLSAKGQDYFKRIQDAAARMQQLILDLLSFSRIDSTERKFESINLSVIIDKLKTTFKEELQEKNATIEATGLCDLYIIPFQFNQLFQNLISNALKFSTPGLPPHIIIHGGTGAGDPAIDKRLSPRKQYCHISFTDNGIGFDPAYKEQIFDVFQRLHGRDDYSGTGIGLAIVKKIVEGHNGIIFADSRPGQGARFEIYIPAH